MAADDGATLALQRTIEAEGALIDELDGLAGKLQVALVAADFDSVQVTADLMQTTSARLGQLEAERERQALALGPPGASLAELAGAQDAQPLARAGEQLRARLTDLRETQERNASLVLSASQLVQRWFTRLARVEGPTYGPGGEEQASAQRRFFSGSA